MRTRVTSTYLLFSQKKKTGEPCGNGIHNLRRQSQCFTICQMKHHDQINISAHRASKISKILALDHGVLSEMHFALSFLLQCAVGVYTYPFDVWLLVVTSYGNILYWSKIEPTKFDFTARGANRCTNGLFEDITIFFDQHLHTSQYKQIKK